MTFALRDRQRAAVHDMIKGAVTPDGRGQEWKVLIFDNVGKDILAPIIKVKELRDAGVTLNLMIQAQRQPIAEVPAIYFCCPTEENIARIAQDCQAEMYDHVFINFISQVPRDRLENFARQLSGLNSVHHIRVIDQTLSFVALSQDLFTTCVSNTFSRVHSRKASEVDVQDCFRSVVLSLSHVFESLDCLPLVGYVRSGPAQELASQVTSHFADLLRERLLTVSPTSPRPLLLIVDRTFDLSAALHHPFSYRGLLGECLNMSLNKVELGTHDQKKIHELDPDNDAFWQQNGAQKFSEVSQNVEAALASYKREYQAATGGDAASATDADAVTKMLSLAPKLAERKRYLDTHTTIAFSVLNEIKARELDAFNGVEEGILRRDEFDKESFTRLLKPSDNPKAKDNQADRDRLYLIAHLNSDGEQAAFVEQHLNVAKGTRPSVPALTFLKSMQAWNVSGNSNVANAGASGWNFAQSWTKNLTKAFSSSDSTMMMPLTRLVEAIVAPPKGSAKERQKTLDTIAVADPKAPQTPVDVAGAKFGGLVIFVLGGGCLTEYDNLKSWEQSTGQRPVIYGCTEMLNGEAFLHQLNGLGAEHA